MATTNIDMGAFLAFAEGKGHSGKDLAVNPDLLNQLRGEYLQSLPEAEKPQTEASEPSTRYLVNQGYGKTFVYSWTSKRGRGGSDCPHEGAVLQSQAPGITSHTFVVSGKTGDIRINGMSVEDFLALLGADGVSVQDVNPKD